MAESDSIVNHLPPPVRYLLPEGIIQSLRSLTRFTLVRTKEEHLFIQHFLAVMTGYQERTWVFNSEFGLLTINTYLQTIQNDRRHCAGYVTNEPHSAMTDILISTPGINEHFYLILDPDMWLNDPFMVRRLINMATQLQLDKRTVKCMLLIGHPSVTLPAKLQPYFEVIDFDQSTPGVAQKVMDTAKETLEMLRITSIPDYLDKLLEGLTCYEVEEVVTQCIIRTKKPGSDPKFDLKVLEDLVTKRRTLHMIDAPTST